MKIANFKSLVASTAIALLTFSTCHAQKQVPATLELTPSCPSAKTSATEVNPAGRSPSTNGRPVLDAMIEKIRPEVGVTYAAIVKGQENALRTLLQQREQYRVQLNRSSLRVPRSGEALNSATKTNANLLAMIAETDKDLRKVELKIADLNKKRNLNLLAIAWRRMSQQQRVEILDSDCLYESEKTELLKFLVLSNADTPHTQDLVSDNPLTTQ
jgi:hypothetical protein